MLRKIFSKVSGIPEQKLRNEALRKAAIKGRLKRAKKLLAEGADVDFKDVNKLTPLYFAAMHGHVEIARGLLDKGADPNIAREDSLGPPLVRAAYDGDLKMLALLLEKGADINNIDYSRRTALHAAIDRGMRETAAFLIEKGANTNTQDRLGNTPLKDALTFSQPDIAKLLVTHGADVNFTTKQGEDMRALAKRKGFDDVAAHMDSHVAEQKAKAERAEAEAKAVAAALEEAVAEAATLKQPVKAGKTATFGKKQRPAP